MPAVIVLSENDFSIEAGDGVAKLVSITSLLKHGSGNAQITDTARDRVAAKQIRHLLSAKAEESAIRRHRHWSNGRKMRSTEQAEALAPVEREQPPSCVSREQQAAISVVSPPNRPTPIPLRQIDGFTLDLVSSNIVAPEPSSVILPKNSVPAFA